MAARHVDPSVPIPATGLQSVCVADTVYQACLQQALSTEREEIMGILFGKVDPDGRGYVWGATLLPRSDKRSDRVEIPPEALINLADNADTLGSVVGQHTRVVGWYHSHPHITPYPSHVDLASQATYQMMEKCWVGLIFSVFNSDGPRGRVTLHSFQTLVAPSGQRSHVRVPVYVVPTQRLTMGAAPTFHYSTVLPEVLRHEAEEAYEHCLQLCPKGTLPRRLAHGVREQHTFTVTQLLVVEARHMIEAARAMVLDEAAAVRRAAADLRQRKAALELMLRRHHEAPPVAAAE